MKRLTSIFSLLVLMLGLSQYAKAQTQSWTFASVGTTDKTNLDADTQNWTYESNNTRWLFQGTITNAALTANNVELEFTKGLTFTTTGADQIRVDSKKGCLTLNNKAASLTISNVKAGQELTVECQSSNSSTARKITASNVQVSSGFVESTSKTTNKGTVLADGSIKIETTGGMYIYSIKVATPGEEGGEDTPVADDFSVISNMSKNQAILILNDNTKKYYNTESLSDISFEGKNVTVNLKDQNSYTFKENVSGINFRKADNTTNATIDNTADGVQITEAKGWLESAYVKFALLEGAKSYNVYVKGGQYTDFTKIDEQLVRNYGTYGRADVVGLKADSYSLKVVPVDADKNELTDKASEATNMVVKSHNRAGFAHKGMTGVGAYNNDGTLKTGAKVLYITKDNFNTVTLELNVDNKPQTFTGLGKILEAKQKKNLDTTPLAVRIIGEIKTSDTDADQRLSDEDGLQLKGNSETSEMNVTLEGIGDDATFNGFGMTFYNGTSVEMRNIAVINFKDDGIQLKGTQHAWIHHNDFFYGNAGSAADQAKGDGSLDVKDDSRYCTFSYNHFWDSGKTSLCGMKSETGDNWLSYHHNWFDHSDSRHPRVRKMSVHVWNNYYDGVSKIGVGAVAGANIFVESNYFRNSKNPMLISEQGTDGKDGFADDHDGGMIKAFGNVLTGKSATTFIPSTKSATEFDAYVAETREEKVPNTYKSVVGSYVYNNFDTDATKMYEYTPDAADDVPAVVTGYWGAGRLNHGDLQWTFNNDVDDAKDAVDADLKAKVTNYKTSLVGIFGDDNSSTGTGGDNTGGDNTGGDNTGDDTPAPEGTITCSFPYSGSFFTITGSTSTSKGSATVDGTTYTTCLKLESSTSVKFTLSGSYKMTLYFASSETGNIKIDGTKKTSTTNELTETLASGSHELTKADSRNLFYIKLEPISE